MKKFDDLDSLTHLDFPNSSAKSRREKWGSILLSAFAIFGLFAMSSPSFDYIDSGATESKKATKFWLTPSDLNAEKTAFNSSSVHFTKAGTPIMVAANTVAVNAMN